MFLRNQMRMAAEGQGGAGGAGTAAAGAGAADAGAAAGAGAGAAGAAAGAQGSAQDKGQQGAADKGGQQQTGKPPEGGKAADAKASDGVAPFAPKLPEGMELDKETLGEFNAIFADAKMSVQERQQRLIDLQVKTFQKSQQAAVDTIAAQPAKDLDAIKTDKDFGGPNFEKTVAEAQRIERLAFGDELGKLLKPFGMQSNPTIIKGLARLGRLIASDSTTEQGKGGPPANDAEAQMRNLFPKSYEQMKASARK